MFRPLFCQNGDRMGGTQARGVTPHPPLTRSPFPHWGRLGLFAHGTAGDRQRPTVCTQFPSFRRGDHRSPAVAFRYLSLRRRSAQDVFRFRSRNRRCSADEEKLRETQSVSYSYPPSGGTLDSAVQIPAFLAFPSGGRWRVYLAG